MSRMPARRTTPRRAARQAARRNTPQRASRPSRIDAALSALPVSESALRRAVTWAILGMVGAAALAAAAWLGVPGMIGVAVAEGIGRAGLRVEQIEVTGLKRMDRMSVYAVALGQQSRAMPLVDLDAVRGRLLEYGWIADARVSRRLPNTLVVDIVERTPAAIWQNNGQLMLIDAQGTLLEPVSPEAMPNLPLVIGDGANAQEPAYQRLMKAAPALKPLVKAATWIGNRRWDLTFVSGEQLALPEGEEEAARALIKFAELDGRERLLGRGYLRFDMRDPKKLVIRMPGRETRRAITGEESAT